MKEINRVYKRKVVDSVSAREMESILEMLMGSIGAFIGPIIATLLSGVILTYCIRWFIFAKAGEKGWKALIPFYSDYINYKIAWDGRIYIALLIGTVGSTVLGALIGLLSAGLGMVISVVLSTIVAGAKAVAGMILQFKFARAFGKNDYFAVGLYFLNNVFAAILAFGECEYRGTQGSDGIGVPKFIDQLGQKNQNVDGYRPAQPMQQNYPQQYQQPMNTGSYPPVQQYQQPYGGGYAPAQRYPQQPTQQNPMNQGNFHQ